MRAEEAFERYHEALFRFVYRLTHRADIAEDVTQECFLILVRSPERFDRSRGTVKTWLFGIARNLVLKQYRDHQAESPMEENSFEPASNRLMDVAVSSAVEVAIGKLPALQQEALILFEYEGFTLEEISQIVGADLGTVKSRLHRARQSLRKTLTPYRRVEGIHGAS